MPEARLQKCRAAYQMPEPPQWWLDLPKDMRDRMSDSAQRLAAPRWLMDQLDAQKAQWEKAKRDKVIAVAEPDEDSLWAV